jgi:hypothetical protein
VNATEIAVLQIMICDMLGHNYNSMSCDSETSVDEYKTNLLKQKIMGETGTTSYETTNWPG